MAYTDAFTGVNGTELSSYSANWVSVGPSSNIVINNNGAKCGASGIGAYYYNQTANSKHYAQLKITTAPGPNASQIGPAIRVQAGGNFYYCLAGDTLVWMGEFVNNSYTDWDSGQSAHTQNDVLRLEIDSATEGTVYYKVNGSTIATYTGKTNLTGGRFGICHNYYSAATAAGDDWEGGDLVTSVNGTVSQALAALTDSAAGTLPIAGAAVQTLAAVSSAAGGIGPITGVVSQNLAALTPTAAGKVIVVGAEAQTLAALGLTGAGSSLAAVNGALYSYLDDPTIFAEAFAPATGTLARALAVLAGVNAGTVLIAGVEASTFAALVDSAAGQVPVGGASAAALTALTVLATGTGAAASNGVVDAVLSAAVISSGGTLVIAGQESTALEALTRLLYGTLIVNGAEASNLAALVPSAAGTLPIVGASTPALASLAISATGVPGEYTSGAAAINLAALAINAAGFLRVGGDLSQALAVLAISATGTRGAVPFLNVGVPIRASSRSTLVSSGRQTLVPTKKG